MITRIRENVETLAVETIQDCTPILDANKADFNSGLTGKTRLGWGRKVAEIPLVVVEMWKNKYGVDAFNKDHAQAVRKLLNSNEWAYLRTAPGCL
jgi:hypothetical protein